MSQRLELFNIGLQRCEELLNLYPEIEDVINSIRKQINFLIEIENGQEKNNRSRLDDIIIDVLTVREIEPRDSELSEIFYKISSEAKNMQRENGNSG
nr:immunity protein Tsi6 family protein [Acinetobacter sp. Marseille-Q1620]